MPTPIRIDRQNQERLYMCSCGRTISIPFTAIVADDPSIITGAARDITFPSS